MPDFITLAQAIDLTTQYRSQMELILIPELRGQGILPICETFNASAFAVLIEEPGCVFVRVYLGMDQDKKIRVLAVGVNSKGEDILPAAGAGALDGGANILEDGQRCPDICPPHSPINH